MHLRCPGCSALRRVWALPGTALSPSTTQNAMQRYLIGNSLQAMLHTPHKFPITWTPHGHVQPRTPPRTDTQQPSTSQCTRLQCCHVIVEGRQRSGTSQGISNKAFFPSVLRYVHKVHHAAAPQSPECLAQPQHRRRAFRRGVCKAEQKA